MNILLLPCYGNVYDDTFLFAVLLYVVVILIKKQVLQMFI